MSRVPYLDVMTIRPSQAAYRDVSVLSSSSSISGFQGNKNVFIPDLKETFATVSPRPNVKV